MGAMPNEPSMEEILSSIKRIIAEEDLTSAAPRAPRKAGASSSPINGTINGEALGSTDADAMVPRSGQAVRARNSGSRARGFNMRRLLRG